MKILMLTQYLTIGGLEKMILLLSRGLQKLSQEVGVYVYDHPASHETLASLFRQHNISVEFYPKKSGFSIETVKHISQLINDNSYSVIHTHDLGSLIYGIIVKYYILFTQGKKIPVLHTQHSFIHINKSKIYPYYEKFFTRLASQVCVVHQSLLTWYRGLKISVTQFKVIPNGVDFPNQILTPKEKLKLRQTLETEFLTQPSSDKNLSIVDKHWILSLGRLSSSKGSHDLLHIWSQLEIDMQKKSCLIIVGPFQDEQTRIELLSEWQTLSNKENVFFVGSTFTPETWFRAADVFITASYFEGHSLSLIEALGSGLPAIVSDIPGHQMQVKNALKFFNLGDSKYGALILTNLLIDRTINPLAFYENYWHQGGYYRENLSHIIMAQKYLALYRNLV